MAAEIQGYADSGDFQNFHSALKQVYGQSDRSLAPVRCPACVLLMDGKYILNRWREHYSVLLNVNNPSDRQILDRIPQRDPIPQMDTLPTLQEVEHAVLTLKNRKSPGVDGVPAEVWKHGGPTITKRLHELIWSIWEVEKVPQQWKVARLISIFNAKVIGPSAGTAEAYPYCLLQARY